MKSIIYELNNMKYIVRYPNDFDSSRKYPVILCLHGAGFRGHDTERLSEHPLLRLTESVEEFPFIVVAPQCSENTWFDMWPNLKSLVREIAFLPRTDAKRIYLTGNSMGGYATWQLAMSMPEYFAAIAPICGGGMYWNADRLASTPVWAFHGAQDSVVLPCESEHMVDAVHRAGGHAKLTVFPDAAHDSWTSAYSNPKLYTWFLSNENERISTIFE